MDIFVIESREHFIVKNVFIFINIFTVLEKNKDCKPIHGLTKVCRVKKSEDIYQLSLAYRYTVKALKGYRHGLNTLIFNKYTS